MAPWTVGAIGIAHPFVIPAYVGKTTCSASYAPDIETQMPVPSGTQPGDLLVLGLLGGFDDGSSLAQCSDTRMVELNNQPTNGRPSGVWVGYAETPDVPILDGFGMPVIDPETGLPTYSHRPVDIQLRANYSPTGQFSSGLLTCFRAAEGVGLTYAPSRVASVRGAVGTLMPALDGIGSGAIAVFFSSAGIGGVAYPDWGNTDTFVFKADNKGSYTVVSMGVSEARRIGPEMNPSDQNSYGATLVGLK